MNSVKIKGVTPMDVDVRTKIIQKLADTLTTKELSIVAEFSEYPNAFIKLHQNKEILLKFI